MRLGIVVGAGETWGFFREIHASLASQHAVSVFEPRTFRSPVFAHRIDRFVLHRDLDVFMRRQDAVFFEWASHLLAVATHLPKRCPIIVRLHRYEMFEWLPRINWAAVDRVILVSHAMQRKFAAALPAHAYKTVVISEGVDTQRFSPQPREFRGNMGILCWLSPRKRVYELILAFHELARQRADLHLHIAGGKDSAYGDYYDAIIHLIAKLNLQQRVTLHGEPASIADWYRDIDIFISNSFSEGLQVAPMEAMASGCYCLSHRWDGAEELLPEENLFFTDAELQAKALAYCELPEAMRRQQQARLLSLVREKFDIRHVAQQIQHVIEAAAAPGEVQPHIGVLKTDTGR